MLTVIPLPQPCSSPQEEKGKGVTILEQDPSRGCPRGPGQAHPTALRLFKPEKERGKEEGQEVLSLVGGT